MNRTPTDPFQLVDDAMIAQPQAPLAIPQPWAAQSLRWLGKQGCLHRFERQA
jgi:hypothetical protein